MSAALLPDSVPASALKAALDRGSVVLSREIARELRDTLFRDKLRRYLTVEDAESFVFELVARSSIVKPTRQSAVCRDPKDNHVLEAALEAEADFIVTGDADLLALDPFQGIRIVTPRAFLDELEGR